MLQLEFNNIKADKDYIRISLDQYLTMHASIIGALMISADIEWKRFILGIFLSTLGFYWPSYYFNNQIFFTKQSLNYAFTKFWNFPELRKSHPIK